MDRQGFGGWVVSWHLTDKNGKTTEPFLQDRRNEVEMPQIIISYRYNRHSHSLGDNRLCIKAGLAGGKYYPSLTTVIHECEIGTNFCIVRKGQYWEYNLHCYQPHLSSSVNIPS
jgi:hypothetical protein